MAALLLDPGQFSVRLDLEARTDISDGQGGAVATFALVTTLWGRIEPVSAIPEERGGQTLFAVTHRIWVRYRDDLKAGMRFRRGDRTFVVGAFHDPDETRRYLICRCAEDGA